MRGAQHGGKIAAKLAGIPDVQRQQIEQILARPAGLIKLDRRDAYSLLPNLGGTGIVGAMGSTADIALMGTNDGPEQTLLAIEHRYEGGKIGQMAAAMVGIVEQDHVARTNALEALLDGERRP